MIDFLIISFIILLTIFLVMFIIIWQKSYRVRLRDPLNNSVYIKDIWVLEKIDKTTGERIWQNVPFFFEKFKSSRPKDEVINVGLRGRLFAEAYKISEDEFIWITDTGISGETLLTESGKMIADSFEPFSHTQRTVLVHQNIKAEEINRTRKWSPAEVLQFAMLGSFLLVIVCGFVFGADILKEWNNIQGSQDSMLKSLDKITSNIAVISTAVGVNIPDLNVKVSQTVSKKNNTIILQTNETPPIRR